MIKIERLVLLALTVSVCFFTWKGRFESQPIISSPENAKIIEVEHVLDADGNTTDILDYKESAVINYLSNCYEKRTITEAYIYQVGDFELIVTLFDGNIVKQLLLRNGNSYSFTGYGKPKYTIQDEEQVLNDLLHIFNIT